MDSNQLQRFLPYLPIILSHIGACGFGGIVGFIFKGWLSRSQPTQVQVVAKVLVAAPLLLLYVASVVCKMFTPAYETPYPLHVLIALIVSTLFPKQFFKLPRLSFKPDDPELPPSDEHEHKRPPPKPDEDHSA